MVQPFMKDFPQIKELEQENSEWEPAESYFITTEYNPAIKEEEEDNSSAK